MKGDPQRATEGHREPTDERTEAIIGAALEVHRTLGHGFLEAVYQEAFSRELSARGIAFDRERSLPIRYKGLPLAVQYRADFVCHGDIIVELKALDAIGPVEMAQAINYLRATGFHLALILNFGTGRLGIKRVVLDRIGGPQRPSVDESSGDN